MSIRRVGRPPLFRFEIGQLVRSRAVGVIDAFAGEIVDRFRADGRGVFYHVKHPDGSLWHRDHKDLTLTEQARAA